MRTALISNPPYNMKWRIPAFAQIQPRFKGCYTVPPESNANFAFIMTGLESNDRCVYLLPESVMNGGTKEEKEIRRWLIEKNMVEAVIMCPDNMFESTRISTCIIVLDKNKSTTTTEMVDMRKKCKEEVREQRGQYGSKSHTNRMYKKKYNVFTEEVMTEAIEAIEKRADIPEFCKPITIESIKEEGYTLVASHYLETAEVSLQHRSYNDIVNDINRITREKNACKLTLNASLAKSIGFDIELFKKNQEGTELDELLAKLGAEKLERQDYFTASKKANEIKFENNSKEHLSSILVMILQTWKQHIFYLNQEENRYLTELRDALLPDLMSGKINM